MTKSNEAFIAAVSLTDETNHISFDFNEGQRTITLTRSYETPLSSATLMFDISSGASLEIDGTLVDGNQYTFDLTTSKNLQIRIIAENGQAINLYTLKIVYISNTDALIDSVASLDPSIMVEFANNIIQVNYDYNTTATEVSLSFEISKNAAMLLDGEEQSDWSAIHIPLRKENFAIVKEDKTVVITAENGSIGEYILRLLYTPFFSFSTADMNDHTQPGSHLLVGYAELHAQADNAKIYAIALPTTETAPADIHALKSLTPSWQIYDLQKNKAQWLPLLNLLPQTDYHVYLGIEHDGGVEYTPTPLAISTIAPQSSQWGILRRNQIKAYTGQNIILPMVKIDNTSTSQPKWTWAPRDSSNIIFTQGYSIDTTDLPNANAQILGQETDGFISESNYQQFHLQMFGMDESQDNTEFIVTQFQFIPGSMSFAHIDLLDVENE